MDQINLHFTLLNMIKLGFILLIFYQLFCTVSACARAEYEVNGECCPMCAPGNRVYWHCTVDTSTTCVPCLPSTYTDEPNGLDKCILCSVCDAGGGLRVKRSCTRSADTVCEPQEGFYCIEQNKGSCRSAVKHSECHPGQYIRQAGTANTDTVCVNCTDGTYSNGSFTTCQPHSKCETKGLSEIKPGTASSDSECGSSTSTGTIVGIIAAVVLLVTAGTSSFYCFILKNITQTNDMENNPSPPIQECGSVLNQCDTELILPDSTRPLISPEMPSSRDTGVNMSNIYSIQPTKEFHPITGCPAAVTDSSKSQWEQRIQVAGAQLSA